jgi:hypothetical protein
MRPFLSLMADSDYFFNIFLRGMCGILAKRSSASRGTYKKPDAVRGMQALQNWEAAHLFIARERRIQESGVAEVTEWAVSEPRYRRGEERTQESGVAGRERRTQESGVTGVAEWTTG